VSEATTALEAELAKVKKERDEAAAELFSLKNDLGDAAGTTLASLLADHTREELFYGRPSTQRALSERLWEKVSKSEGCWTWTGAKHRGYGRIYLLGRPLLVHRVAWEMLVGPIELGMTIDHLCANRECVNPSHLEVVSRDENTRRAAARVTHCPKGHAYDVANTYRNPTTDKRRCRACDRAKRHAVTCATRMGQRNCDCGKTASDTNE
jgi:hypothetical protein